MDSINGIAAQLGRTNRNLYKIHRIVLDQAKRIERLEQVILAMSKGTESSPPDDGPGHTHWTYPLNKAQGLMEEIRRQKQHDA